MVMEHDVVIDKLTLLPFLRSILTQAGFVEQKPSSNDAHNLATEGSAGNKTMLSFLMSEESFTAVYKVIEDCRRLRHSIREIKPVLSFLIHGGHQEAKLLAKKFSTRLPIKRCRAILTIFSERPAFLNGRAPRARRVKELIAK